MKKQTLLAAAGIAIAGMAASAQAGKVVVDGIGGAVTMESATIPGVFDASSPVFTNSALSAIHNDLKGKGITTDGVVTFILMDTTDGLTFAALVDDVTQPGGFNGFTASLGMSTTAPITGVDFINDANGDITQQLNPGNGTITSAGLFDWDADHLGDAFAWANLDAGDFVSFNFTEQDDTSAGLASTDTFQFVSWNGAEWEVVANGDFTNDGQFAFSFTVLPVPAAALMGVAGLAGVVIRRRRQAKRA